MAKKQIKTTTIEEVDPEQLAGQAEPESVDMDPGVNELMEYLEGIASSASIIKIYKIVEGRKAWCGTCEPGTVTEDAIIRKWGGGSYYLIAFNNGKFVPGGTRRIDIYEMPVDPLKAVQNPVENTGANQGLIMLQEQINRQHEMILKMLESNKTKDVDLPGLISMVRDLTPKAPDIASVLPVVMDLFTKTMDVARETASGGDDKGGWLKLAAGALEKLPGIVGQMAMVRAAGAGGGATMERGGAGAVMPDTSEGADMNKMIIAGGISWLKKKAMAGKAVESTADFLIDNMDDETFGPAAMALLNMPFEHLGQIDPDILKEPLRTWFKKLYDELQTAVTYAQTKIDEGPDGGDTNAP